MTAPNITLQNVRRSLGLSQDDMARAIRAAGGQIGEPNEVSKRTVQRWEAGAVVPIQRLARALERVTGLPMSQLGFGPREVLVGDDGLGGHDVQVKPITAPDVVPTAASPAPRANLSGIWLSRYEYFSSGRNLTFTGLHYVTLLQHGDRLTVRSLPGSSDSPLSMDLTLDGNVITGTWVEQTAADGYYRGARYHGAIQMLVEPTGRRMVGKWVGFGAEMDVNTGPWELVFQESSTSKSAMERYNRPPEVG